MNKILLIMLMTLCISCNKKDQTEIFPKYFAKKGLFYNTDSEIKIYNGMLAFSSPEAFIKKLTELIAADEQWNEAFLESYLNLDYAQLTTIPKDQLHIICRKASIIKREIEFDEDKAFKLFENELHFYSLRKSLSEKEASFLKDPSPDWSNNPSQHYITGEAERTLFDTNGAVIIGRSIFKINPNGLIHQITDGNLGTLKMLKQHDDNEVYHGKNVIAHNLGGRMFTPNQVPPSNCEDSKSDAFPPVSYNYGNNHYTGLLAIRNYVFYAAAVSNVKHYEWNGFNWGKANAFLQCQNWGYTSDTTYTSSCGPPVYHQSNQKLAFSSRIISRKFLQIGKPTKIRTQSNWMHSSHGANTSGHLFHLVW